MCIIALKPAGLVIPEKTIKAMWDNNDDGAGLMYAEGGRVRIVKGLMTFENFLKAYNRVGNHKKIVMHFRIRTHGAISPRLTHPFWIVKGEMGMVHNGIITGLGAHGNDEESDTSIYAKILAHRYPDPLEALTNPDEHKKIEGEIGWSKLVFLTGDGDHMIINEKSGQWDNGCWFSNGSFRDSYKKWSYTGSYYGYNWDGDDDDRPLYRVAARTYPSGGSYLESWKDDTKPNLPAFQPSVQSAGELARRQESYDAEWEAMVARYEAKYGSAED